MEEVIIRSVVSHESPLGPMWSHWTDRGLYRFDWDAPDDPSRTSNRQSSESQLLAEWLGDYFRSGNVSFDSIPVDPSGWTEFTSKIYDRCREIPAGKTSTYKQIAEAAGSAGASRAVGAAMSRNRVLLVIPCHRVLAANGGLCGFSAPGGLSTKQSLLDLERNHTWPAFLV